MSDYCLHPNQCGPGMDCSPCYRKRITELEQQLAEQEQGIDNAVKTIVHQGELIDAAEAKLTERDKLLDECAHALSMYIDYSEVENDQTMKDHADLLTKLQEREK